MSFESTSWAHRLRPHCWQIRDIATTRRFWLRLAPLSFGSLAKPDQFFRHKFTELSRLLVQYQRPVSDPTDLLDKMSDLLEHLAEFAVAAFDQHHFVPRVVALADLPDAGRRSLHATFARPGAIDGHAFTKQIETFLRWLSADFYQVGLFYARRRFGQLVGKVPIVRDQQQAFAQVIEAPDGVKALVHLRKELHHCRPSFRIADCGHIAPRLIQHEVTEALRSMKELSVDADVVAAGIRFGTKLGDDLSVDLDPAFANHLLGMTSAGYAGSR
jgi:hypothetical protein